jgi:hypothetical protein
METIQNFLKLLKIELSFNFSARYTYPEEMDSVCQRDMHSHVHCSTIHDSQKMGIT